MMGIMYDEEYVWCEYVWWGCMVGVMYGGDDVWWGWCMVGMMYGGDDVW